MHVSLERPPQAPLIELLTPSLGQKEFINISSIEALINGGPNRNRTRDLLGANEALSLLSYWPKFLFPNIRDYRETHTIFSLIHRELPGRVTEV